MNAQRVKIKIEGIAPILFDRYSGISDQNDQEAQKNAIHKLYLNEKDEICIPAVNLKASIREASSEIGKKMESKKRRQAVRAGLFFTTTMLSTDKKEPDTIHAELVTRQTGAKVTRVITYRPCLNNWSVEAEAILYMITPDFLNQALELGGIKYGLCGYRPEYGRFVLKEFEIIGEQND